MFPVMHFFHAKKDDLLLCFDHGQYRGSRTKCGYCLNRVIPFTLEYSRDTAVTLTIVQGDGRSDFLEDDEIQVLDDWL